MHSFGNFISNRRIQLFSAENNCCPACENWLPAVLPQRWTAHLHRPFPLEKIEVFNAEKIDGVWEQRLHIHYNCVGTIEIPTVLPLPIPEVSVNTRKGVVVNYAPCELAV